MAATRLSNRAFGFAFTIVFTVVGAIAWLAFDTHLLWPFIVSAIFLVLALALPSYLMPLNRLWGRFAIRLARFNNGLILGVIYFVVLTPLGLLLRGRDTMRRTAGRAGGTSYLLPVRRQTTAENLHDFF